MEENKELSKHELKEVKREQRDEERNKLEKQNSQSRLLRKTGYYAIAIVVIAGILSLLFYIGNRPGKYDSFITCMAEKEVKFYGSFQCSFCAEQKKLFGNSHKQLEPAGVYIECGALSQPAAKKCIDAGIQSYPTWIFADGTRLTGVRELEELSQKSACPLA